MSLSLFVICAASAFSLSFVYRMVAPSIAAQAREEKEKALHYLIPDCEQYPEKSYTASTGKKKIYYEARKAGALKGYIIDVEAKGYGGPIDMMVGVDAQGTIQGIYVLSQQETPGLGDRVREVKQGETKPWFLKQFEGRKPSSLDIRSIDTITGATITSKGVLDGVKTQTEEFLRAVNK